MRKKKKDGLVILVIVLAVLVVILAVLLIIRRAILPSVLGKTRQVVVERELRLGKRYLSEMEYDKAVTAFSKVVEIDDKNTAAYTGLGDAYTGKSEWKSAVENYDQAVITVAGVLPPDGATEEEIRTLVGQTSQGTADLPSASHPDTEEVYDAVYVIDVVGRRDHALESGLLALEADGVDGEELIQWLEVVGHPEYQPKDRELRERIGRGGAGSVPSEDPAEQAEKKIRELADEYGILSFGEETVEVPIVDTERSTYPDITGEAFLKDRGLLAADLYDYDGDGTPELLTIRRDPVTGRSSVNPDYVTEWTGAHLEVYELTENGYVLADSTQAAVRDEINLFVSGSSFEFFRCTDGDGKTRIYVESYVTEQDHADDVSLVAFSYHDGTISMEGGARMGFWFSEDSFGIYFEPDSADAAMDMSGFFYTESGWGIVVRPTDGSYENSEKAFVQGLQRLGLQRLRSHDDYRLTADQCYAPVSGKMVRLGRMRISQDFERDNFNTDPDVGYLYFVRERVDCMGTLTSISGSTGQSSAAEPPQQEAPEQPQDQHQDQPQDLTMESIGLSYGHYEGVKPQGDGAIPTEMDLYEDGTFRLSCIFPIFSQNDPMDQDYHYTYTGTYTVDRIDADGHAVLLFKCDAAEFEMTWDGRSLWHEDFYVSP